MAGPSSSWNLVRVYGTWRGMDGALKAGTYKVTIPARITNATDDAIIPAGLFASGSLQTSVDASPSLDVMVPATDDPDNAETGWKVTLEVNFNDAAGERYVIDVPVAGRPIVDGGTGTGVNLRTVVLSQSIPQQVALYKVGVPGGLAQLDESGQVVDADGNPVTGGGAVDSVNGQTGVIVLTAASVGALPTSYAPSAVSISDSTATGRAVLTAADAAAARTAIGAGTSNLALGTTGTTAKAGDYQPTAANISDATTVGRNVLKAADAATARTAIGAGTASTKTDVGLANVDNTSDAAKPVSTATQTALNAKAPLASPTFTGTVSGVTKAMVGLTNVDDTADTAKPISTATQAALDEKQDVASMFDATVDAVTGQVGRVGLTVTVGYNDGGAVWPSVPSNLLTDPNVAIHWVGGTEATPPPTNAGPGLWDRPVV